jgi:hypothetical protein
MSNQQDFMYHVDLALCIDATGSMRDVIERVKENALTFHSQLKSECEKQGKHVDVFRVRVLAYRDYYDTKAPAMSTSDFFTLPTQQNEFKAFVNTISADGGGDEPENGLEAVALALQSNWTTGGNKRRHVVVVWTDATAHPLEKSGKPTNYPSNMPADFHVLTDSWTNEQIRSRSAKRLVLFAPDATPWTEISTHWDNVAHMPTKAGEGMADEEFNTILDLIVRSI